MGTKAKSWKIETPHRKGCWAAESGAPFQTLADQPTAFRNFAGNTATRGANHIYIRVRCNNTSCPAIAAFHLHGALVAIGLNDEL